MPLLFYIITVIILVMIKLKKKKPRNYNYICKSFHNNHKRYLHFIMIFLIKIDLYHLLIRTGNWRYIIDMNTGINK